MKPPKMKFTSKIWHPNVHDNGEVSYFLFYNCKDKKNISKVCISILHDPGDDKYGYEKASERWLPVHTVEVSYFINSGCNTPTHYGW